MTRIQIGVVGKGGKLQIVPHYSPGGLPGIRDHFLGHLFQPAASAWQSRSVGRGNQESLVIRCGTFSEVVIQALLTAPMALTTVRHDRSGAAGHPVKVTAVHVYVQGIAASIDAFEEGSPTCWLISRTRVVFLRGAGKN